MGVISGRTRSATTELPASHESTAGKRDDRVQLVEADPEFGFNFSYWLATPESYRSEPVPLLFEMNNADEEDSYEKVKFDRAKKQINTLGFQGAWLSEELGVPHIKPIVPRPNGDPIDATHWTILLDRETMLLDSTEYERLDRQLLRMADHARQEVLTDLMTHEKLLFYGNSSEGVVAERMAAMHPERIIAAAGGGLNGFVLLPFEELGGHTLNYPVGVADFDAILGKPYDRDAHDGVDMFYFQGGQDPKNRLKMESGFGGQLWNDRQVYDAARAVYGADIVAERFPRCHIAFEKAGIDAQFRIYPEMTHDPRPASHALLDFYQKSIAGEDVSEFGQRLELPLDREPIVASRAPANDGINLEVTVSGGWLPPEGLVSYSWSVGGEAAAAGRNATINVDGPGAYKLALEMKTAHGQRAKTTKTVTVYGISDLQWSTDELVPGKPLSATLTIENPLDRSVTETLGFRQVTPEVGPITHPKEITIGPGETRTVSIDGKLKRPGEHVLVLGDNPVSGTVTVLGSPWKPVSFIAEVPEEPVTVGTTVEIIVHVVFTESQPLGVPQGEEFGFPLRVNGETANGSDVEVGDYTTRTVTFDLLFSEPGDYRLTTRCCGSLYPEPIELGEVIVEPKPTSTPTEAPTVTPSPTSSQTDTRTQTSISEPEADTTETPGQPGLGIISAIAGIGSAVSYLLYRDEIGDK